VAHINELPKATLYEMALVLLGSRHKYVCEGRSMNPTLKDGEVVLVDRAAAIGVGDIVVARHPFENTEVVKRVARITDRGDYFLVGDNPDDSIDSRDYGAVTREYLKGKVVSRMG
jgi:nickel-type superoxide dismutase maturation protease